MAVLKVLVTAAPLRIEGINYRDVFARETLIYPALWSSLTQPRTL